MYLFCEQQPVANQVRDVTEAHHLNTRLVCFAQLAVSLTPASLFHIFACLHVLLSGWNQQSAQAQLEKTLQVICQELQAEGVCNMATKAMNSMIYQMTWQD